MNSTGRIIEYKDGIAVCSGLETCGFNELVHIKHNAKEFLGLALDLKKDTTGVLVLEGLEDVSAGDEVNTLHESLSIYVDDDILGKILDPVGNLVYERNKKFSAKTGVHTPNGIRMPLEKIAPGVFDRKNVTRPLQTGIMAIDTMIPIGRGQRQLIIGDSKTGKTSICIDTILAQKNTDVLCVYVLVGQKAAKVTQLKNTLEDNNMMVQSVIVCANASDPAALQYLAPFTGTAIAEYFAGRGRDVLIAYDDLSKHANAYREISLILKRFPGREAFPGDIFYLHSRLLERSIQFNDKLGGGSITALPVIETQAGDVSSYISTNVISITDGQIYLDADIFNKGQLPAINIGTSVSRVGSSAQLSGMKKLSGNLKNQLSQFEELKSFAQFGSDLDEETKKKIQSGNLVTNLLRQDLHEIIAPQTQIIVLYAAIKGYFDKCKPEKIQDMKKRLVKFLSKSGNPLIEKLKKNGKLTEEAEKEIKVLLNDFDFDIFSDD